MSIIDPLEQRQTNIIDPLEAGIINPMNQSMSAAETFQASINKAREGMGDRDKIPDIGMGALSGLKMAPFKLAEAFMGILDTIDQYAAPWSGAKKGVEQATGIKMPRLRDASLYFRDLANKQAPELGTPGYYTQAATASILSNLPAIVATFATGSELVGLVGMGVQAAEDKKNERIIAGDSDEKATLIGGLYGLAEGLGEKIPLHILKTNKGLKAILLSSLAEIPTELATTTMQNGIDIGFTDQNMSFKDWMKSYYDTAIVTGIAAPFTAGLGRGLGVGAQSILNKREAAQRKPIIQVPEQITPEKAVQATIDTKAQTVTATVDGKQAGSYDGETLTISPEYEGNKRYIASTLIDAYNVNKENLDATLTKASDESKINLSNELLSQSQLEKDDALKREAEIRTLSQAGMASELDTKRGKETQQLTEKQTYEDFIAQVEQTQEPEKPILEALNEGDLDTLTRYANRFPSAQLFADALGEKRSKPSRIWKDNGYKSAFDFYRKRRTTQQGLNILGYEGFVNEDTGELIGSDYQTADSATLDGLLSKLERMKEWYAANPIVKAKKKLLPYKLELSIEKVKTVIRERTGQTRVDSLVKEMDALTFAYKTAQTASREAYRAGDRAGALREHERMTLIQQLKTARMNLNKETKTAFRFLDSVNKKLPTIKMTDEYRSAIESALSYDGNALETFSLKQLEAGDLVFIPEDMIDTLKQTQREGITLDQLRNQRDIVKTLLYQARAMNKVETTKEKFDFAETVNTIVEQIGQAWHKDTETLLTRLNPSEAEKQKALGYEGVSRFKEIVEITGGLMSYPKKAEYIIERATAYMRNSKLYQTTFQRSVDAERVEITRRKAIEIKLKEAVELIAPDMKSILQDEYVVPGLLNPITKQKAIMVALNSGNQQNRAALRGVGLNDDNIDAITTSLTDNETEFVIKIWDLINNQYEAINEQYKKLTGLPMPKVDGQYFPLKYNTDTPQTAYIAEQEAKQDLFKTYSSISSVYRGFTKGRVKQTGYPPKLDFSVIANHLADVNHFIAWGVPVRDINRIITNPRVKESLIQSVGESQYDQLRPWLKGIANDHFDGLKIVNKVLGKMVNNSSVAILGYSLSTTLLQPSAVFQAINYQYENSQGKMQRVNPNEIIKGYLDFYKSYGENADIIYSLSPFMSDRTHNLDYNIRRALEHDNKKPFNDHKFRQAAFAMMGFTDKLTTLPVWWTGYNIGMKETGDMEQAVNFADKMVRNTQGSGAAKDLSEIQRGGPVRHAFTMFQTFFNSTYNEWGKTKDLAQAGRVSQLDYAKTFFWITFLPALFSAIMRYRDELLDEPEKIANEIIGYGLGSIPIVGGFANSLIGGYDYRPSPAANIATEIIYLRKSSNEESILKHGVSALGYLTGLPTRQALLTGEYIFDAFTDETKNPLEMVYKSKKGGYR